MKKSAATKGILAEYWINHIDYAEGKIEIQDRRTGNVIVCRPPESLSKYRVRQVFSFKTKVKA